MSGMSSSAATSSAASSSSHSGGMHGGMGSGGGACKISMLWNWYTVDSCFISNTWHVRSPGTFAGTCIGVIFLVISLEFLRRAQREFDRILVRRNDALLPLPHRDGSEEGEGDNTNNSGRCSGKGNAAAGVTIRTKGNFGHSSPPLALWQHAVRSFLYMMQFAVGYFVMLLAMYYNGNYYHPHAQDPLLLSLSSGG
ncbi:MAG: Copper Transporter integral membrane protein that functions in high affinity copper transport [Sclerophora amabilis]|nr:MAG: Copper Transporter integral membrane protein that functions in high affinity copper transport [Sclerophora amabilis]